jgi:hypothetical protein
VDALVLEMKLIRDFQPPVNLQAAVHETFAKYGSEVNLVVLVQDGRNPEKARAYFVRRSTFAGSEPVRLGREVTSRMRSRIRSVYYSRPGKRSRGRSLNAVDVDQAGSFEAVIGQLRSYLHDPEARSARVYYR